MNITHEAFCIFCRNRKASCFLVPNLVGLLVDGNAYTSFQVSLVESGSTDNCRVKSPSLGACVKLLERESLPKGISRCQEARLL